MNDLFDDPLFSSMTSKDSQQTAAPSDWLGDLRQAWVDFWSHAFDAARSAIESATQGVPELADFRETVTGVLSDLQDLISNFAPPFWGSGRARGHREPYRRAMPVWRDASSRAALSSRLPAAVSACKRSFGDSVW